MSGQTGRTFKMAFAKFGLNSWGVAASVTKGVYFESDAGLQLKVNQITDNAFGQTDLGPASSGLIEAPDITYKGRDRYEDNTYILEALAMGSPAAVTISTSTSGQVTSWQHIIDLAPTIDGLGATFAIDKNLYVDELTSAKVYGFEETQDSNGSMDLSFKVLGMRPTPISSVNIAATLTGATFAALSNRVVQQQGVFRINAQGGGSLVAADAVKVESVKFSFERTQDAPHVYGQAYVDEPADNGFPTYQIELRYPRMNTVSANSLYNALANGSNFKADWTFTSNTLINSTDAWSKLFQFPHIQLMVDGFSAPTSGAQQVKPVAKFACRLPASAPTGMGGVTHPFRLIRVMQNSVAAF